MHNLHYLLTFEWPLILSHMFKWLIDDLFVLYDWVKWDDLLKLIPVLKVNWKSHGGGLVTWTIWSTSLMSLIVRHHKHASLGGAEAAWVSHVTLRKIVIPDVKEHEGGHVTDTFNPTLPREELRHRQLTVTPELGLMRPLVL